jgi:hypothetical protein
MVTLRLTTVLGSLILAQEKSGEPLSRIDPQTRAKLLAALAGLIILGLGMMALVWLGARVTRRYMNQGGAFHERPPDEDDWARKPLVPAPPRRQQKGGDAPAE